MQVHGNANIIVVMSDKQQPKNAFVREQIKDKPKNYKRMWVRLGESAACGGVFALAVAGGRFCAGYRSTGFTAGIGGRNGAGV